MRAFKGWLAATASVGIALVGARAEAQTIDSPPVDAVEPVADSEELIITGLRRSEAAQQAPVAVTALTSTVLQQRGIEGTSALQFAAPSLQVGQGINSTQVAIRGIGLNFGGSLPAVAIHSDGVYQPRSSMGDLAQADLERVEVLRGPAGTLYGRNANAGVINYITKAPVDGFESYIQAGLGSFETYRVQTMLNFALSDKFRSRTVVDYTDQQDGWLENVLANGQDSQYSKSLAARQRFAIELSPDLMLDLEANVLTQDGARVSNNIYGPLLPTASNAALSTPGAVVTYEPFRTSASDPGGSDRTYAQGSATLTWSLGGAQIKSISAFSSMKDDFFYDADGTNRALSFTGNKSKPQTFTQELNLSTDIGPVSAVAGLFYMDDQAPGYSYFNLNGGVNSLTFHTLESNTKAYAAFADATWAATESLKLMGGVRYSVDDQDVTLHNTSFGVDRCGTAITPASKSQKFNSFTPRLGMQYVVSSDVNLYATASKGFKSGGFNNSGCAGTNIPSYNPEKITAFEVGYKSRIFDRRGTLNFAVFDYDYKDLQVASLANLQNNIYNAASAKVRGAEAEGTWALGEHLTLNASLTFLDAKYEEFSNVDSLNRNPGGTPTPTTDPRCNPIGSLDAPAVCNQILDGNYLNNSPRFSGNFGIAYQTDPMDFGSLTFRVDASPRSKYYFREFNLPEDAQDGYTNVNLSAVWTSPDESVKLRLFGNNVTNEAVIAVMGVDSAILGSRYIQWQPPRQFGVELKKSF
jgi:iron complex outermembrane receptor protein